MPRIYLPPANFNPPVSPLPTEGAEITPITLNFGTFGLLGTGERNGLYSDADGSYQILNGVNTYVPNNTPYASSQDGYRGRSPPRAEYQPDVGLSKVLFPTVKP